jgi:hypothetical protein
MNKTRIQQLAAGVMLVFGVLVALSACNGGTTSIRTLLDDPSRFDKQTVRILGTVEQGIGVGGYGTYHVDDGTGKLWVVSQGGGSPRNGAKVGVEGEFRSAFTLGGMSAAALMEKKRFTP